MMAPKKCSLRNPYSDTYGIQHFDKHAEDYGRPPPGSKTEARGIKAGVHVCREILFLCETINENAEGEEPNNRKDSGTAGRVKKGAGKQTVNKP
ncbi:hypothetical protein ANCCAN_15148 [Ancylostoma caninum]|uniref:Uncharacterized protein n=1 Tax=Ancylostoma caninum TaxID=29170 RepID=A0A368G3A4_ANCCA|nr:hypothetical protein ANCCAN_15148 [Ancylostoma caninum]